MNLLFINLIIVETNYKSNSNSFEVELRVKEGVAEEPMWSLGVFLLDVGRDVGLVMGPELGQNNLLHTLVRELQTVADGLLATDLNLSIEMFSGVERFVLPRIPWLRQSFIDLDRMNIALVMHTLHHISCICTGLVRLCLFFISYFEPCLTPLI